MERIEEIRKKIEVLEKEGKELEMLKNDANASRYFRKLVREASEYKCD